MRVANTTIDDPIYNGADAPSIPSDLYGFGTGSGNGISVSLVGIDGPDCDAPPTSTVPEAMLRPAAQNRMNYATDATSKNWVSQKHLWRAICADSTVDTNAVLHSFKQMAAHS